MGNVVNGKEQYANYCSGCHGSKVTSNKLSVKNAKTLKALNAAINSVIEMNDLSTAMTQQYKLDVAAYIATQQ